MNLFDFHQSEINRLVASRFAKEGDCGHDSHGFSHGNTCASGRKSTKKNFGTIKMTFKELAKIAEKSPGYEVETVDERGEKSVMSNIRYSVKNGRKERSLVLATFTYEDGKIYDKGVFGSDSDIDIVD